MHGISRDHLMPMPASPGDADAAMHGISRHQVMPDAVHCAVPPCMALAQCARDAARDAVLPADYADFG